MLQALEARRQGAALPLKDFHNDIKRRMISRFAFQAERLLDLACGRGGDIHKWARAQARDLPADAASGTGRLSTLRALLAARDHHHAHHGAPWVHAAHPRGSILCLTAIMPDARRSAT